MIDALLKTIANKATEDLKKDPKLAREQEVKVSQFRDARMANDRARTFRDEGARINATKEKGTRLLGKLEKGKASIEELEELEKIAVSDAGSEDLRKTVEDLKVKLYKDLVAVPKEEE